MIYFFAAIGLRRPGRRSEDHGPTPAPSPETRPETQRKTGTGPRPPTRKISTQVDILGTQ
jgi:hypothetical protein